MANVTSNLEAFRYLEIKLKNGGWKKIPIFELVGDITVQEDQGMLSTVTLTLRDKGIPAPPEVGGVEYLRMDPRNIGSMRCRLSFGYARYAKQTRKFYEGFLKELSPSFPEGKDPQVELVFHCSGWELTRVRRKHTYPSLGELQITEQEGQLGDNSDYIYDPSDRSWAVSSNQDFTISLQTIIQNIFDSYGYEVEIKLPDDSVEFTHEDALVQRDETDWGFLTRIGKEYGFGIYSDVVKSDIQSQDSPTTIYKWFVVPLSETHINHYEKNLEFLYHRKKGNLVKEFNPIQSTQYLLLGEPSVDVNSNWQYKPQLVRHVDEDGNETFRFTSVNEDNEVIIYEIDASKLNSKEADQYFEDYLFNRAGWDEAKEFFIRNAIKYHGENNQGQNRSIFQGIEVSFRTIGNHLAQTGFSYPIKGLGSFYSRGLTLHSLTHTVGSKWHTSYNFKMGG